MSRYRMTITFEQPDAPTTMPSTGTLTTIDLALSVKAMIDHPATTAHVLDLRVRCLDSPIPTSKNQA